MTSTIRRRCTRVIATTRTLTAILRGRIRGRNHNQQLGRFRVAAITIGLILPLVGAIAVASSSATSSAAAVNCSAHFGTTGRFGTVELFNYITAYGDPACTGSRYRAFEYVAATYPATTVDYIGFEPSIGFRSWDCGNPGTAVTVEPET